MTSPMNPLTRVFVFEKKLNDHLTLSGEGGPTLIDNYLLLPSCHMQDKIINEVIEIVVAEKLAS